MTATLTMVVTGRNDDYGGDFLARLLESHSINLDNYPDAEMVFVEWNPPVEKPLLAHTLKRVWGKRVNSYVVSSHFSYMGGNRGFAEYIAKNVGIRRAAGPFILSTNAEIILNPSIDLTKLRDAVCYRAVRVNIPRVYKQIVFPIPDDMVLGKSEPIPNDHSGDFILMHKNLWETAGGFNENYLHLHTWKDDMLTLKMMNLGYPIEWLGEVAHWMHSDLIVHSGDSAAFSENKANTKYWGLREAREIMLEPGITSLTKRTRLL
jgi:hypothetical protein